MRLVQSEPSRKYPMIACPSQVKDMKYLNIRGCEMVYDCDEMCLWQLESAENTPSFADGVHKPQFALNCNTICNYLVINASHSCNLCCTYCFASVYNRTQQITAELAIEAVKKLFNPRAAIRVGFFGGEPLMAFSAIRDTVRFCTETAKLRKVQARFHVTTNGTLITEEVAQFLAQHNFSVLISMDGPKDVHNRYRPMKNGQDSYEATMRGLLLLQKVGLSKHVTLRGTFTPGCIDLLTRVKHHQWLVDEGLCAGYSIEPACLSEGCMPQEPQEFSREDLEAAYSEVSVWFIEKLKQGCKPPFFHYDKLLARIIQRKPQGSECGAGKGYLTLNPVGELYACHRETGTKVGHIRTGVDEELRFPWMENRIYRSEACMSCWARYICGGGCRQMMAELCESLNEPHLERCKVMKIMISECLWIAVNAPKDMLAKWSMEKKSSEHR